eukprot:1185219-Prorocentrum_minimum.AAC.2
MEPTTVGDGLSRLFWCRFGGEYSRALRGRSSKRCRDYHRRNAVEGLFRSRKPSNTVGQYAGRRTKSARYTTYDNTQHVAYYTQYSTYCGGEHPDAAVPDGAHPLQAAAHGGDAAGAQPQQHSSCRARGGGGGAHGAARLRPPGGVTQHILLLRAAPREEWEGSEVGIARSRPAT